MNRTQRIFLIAALSGADPRTVTKQLQGKPAHGAVLRQRIEEAARRVDSGSVLIAMENDADDDAMAWNAAATT